MDKHNNQDQDYTSKMKLCLKIKLPNTVKDPPVAPQAENIGGHSGGRGGDVHELPPGYRACEYCDKVFSSGKAWGGHKRHHLKLQREEDRRKNSNNKNNNHEYSPSSSSKKLEKKKNFKKISYGDDHKNNTIRIGDVKVRNGKPTCCLCGAEFPCMPSLFGHMRSHSDNDWKNIQSISNSAARLDFEDDEDEDEDEDVYYNQIQTSPVLESSRKDKRIVKVRDHHNSVNSVDLMSSLGGDSWRRKDFRGRGCLTELIPQAARDLLTLSKSKSEVVPVVVSKSSKKLNYGSKYKDISSKMDFQERKMSLSLGKRRNDVREWDRESEEDEMIPNKKRRRKRSSNEVGSSTGEATSNTSSIGEAAQVMLNIDLNQPYVEQNEED
ncbi:uncharacterized protein LOC126686742 [Mercurialis annua]|uniref:uncharacterized protein LOC126686742 n=1 Tax=Mercurialis annua TaxID=3986 RepID=UPI0021600D30|nr:uncharacterized protein LOC126686742 [Mercurialis annua]